MNRVDYKTNFLPLELQSAGLHKYCCLASVAALMAVIFLGSCWMLAERCASLKNELAIAQKDIQDLDPVYKIAQDIQQRRAAAERICQEYRAAISRRQEWSKVLLDLNRIAPADLWLVELEMGSQQQKTDSEKQSPGERMIMKGGAGDLSAVGILLIELGKLPYFQEPTLESAAPVPDGLSFQITAAIKEVK